MWKGAVIACAISSLGATVYTPPQYQYGNASVCYACECPGDLNGNGLVTINELVQAVNAAVNGCHVPPSPGPTFTPLTKREATVWDAATASAAQACPGDCDHNGVVSPDEKTIAIGIINGEFPLSMCPAADVNGDGRVRANEITMITNAITQGCPQ